MEGVSAYTKEAQDINQEKAPIKLVLVKEIWKNYFNGNLDFNHNQIIQKLNYDSNFLKKTIKDSSHLILTISI